MNKTKLIVGFTALLLTGTSCVSQVANLFPDPADPVSLLECDSYEHLELSGSDYEAISTAPTNESFSVSVIQGQREVAKSSRFSQSVWLAYSEDDEVIGVLTFWEEPGTAEYKFHVQDLYVCTSE